MLQDSFPTSPLESPAATGPVISSRFDSNDSAYRAAAFFRPEPMRYVSRNSIQCRILAALVGPVAQRLEQRTHNPSVPGSNPGGPTSFIAFYKNSCSEGRFPRRKRFLNFQETSPTNGTKLFDTKWMYMVSSSEIKFRSTMIQMRKPGTHDLAFFI